MAFILLSIYYKFNYFQTPDFHSISKDLTTTYNQDYEKIHTIIEDKLLQNLNDFHRGSYLLAQLYFTLLEQDYEGVLEKQDNIEDVLHSEGMYSELADFYVIISIAYFATEDYYNSYVALDKSELFLTIPTANDNYQHELAQTLTVSSYKALTAQLLGLPDLASLNTALTYRYVDLNTQRLEQPLHASFFYAMFNYYYYIRDYETAIIFSDPLINAYNSNKPIPPHTLTFLIRLAFSYASTQNFINANELYNHINLLNVQLTKTQTIDMLLLESKVLFDRGEDKLALQKLIESFSLSQDIKHTSLGLQSLNELILYYEQLNNVSEVNKYQQIKLDTESKIRQSTNYDNLIFTLTTDRSFLTTTYKNHIFFLQLRKNQFFLTLLVSGAILLAGYTSSMYLRRQKTKELNQQIKFLNEHLHDQLKHYQSVTAHQEHVRRLYHDLNYHFDTLLNLLNQKNYTRMNTYLVDLGSQVQTTPYTQLSQHQLLDALLQSKQLMCQKKGIELNTQVYFPESVHLSDIAITTIFSNIFDNAIEACEAITDSSIQKVIDLNVKMQGNLIFITMTNHKQHKVIPKNNLFKTTKKNSNAHGIGLSSVENAIAPYDGTLNVTYTDTSFTINILLRNEQLT